MLHAQVVSFKTKLGLERGNHRITTESRNHECKLSTHLAQPIVNVQRAARLNSKQIHVPPAHNGNRERCSQAALPTRRFSLHDSRFVIVLKYTLHAAYAQVFCHEAT